MSQDTPAHIQFANEEDVLGDPLRLDADDDEEIAVAPPSRRNSRAVAPKKTPVWIFVVGGVIALAGIGAIGLMGVKMMSQGSERVANPYAGVPPPQQPVIIADAPAGVPHQPVVGELASGQQSNPVTVQQVAAAPTQPSAADSQFGHPVPPHTQAGVPAPSPIVGQAPASGAAPQVIQALSAEDAKRLTTAEAGIAKTQEQLAELKGQLDEVKKHLVAIEAAISARKTASKPAPKPAPPVKSASDQAPKKPAPVASKAPAPAAAGKSPESTKPEPAKPEDKPAQAVAPAPAQGAVQGYSITSLIGTRAWLVKRNADGSETEVSVAPGERLDGKVAVVAVDGSAKEVRLENGQRITVYGTK